MITTISFPAFCGRRATCNPGHNPRLQLPMASSGKDRCARAVRCARSACLKAAHAGAVVQFPNTEETELSMPDEHPTPEHILQVGMGFWASKALLSAVEIGVFTELGRHPEDLETLRGRLGLDP